VFAKSGRQSQLADSTGYAETIALHEASHWVIGYRRIMANLCKIDVVSYARNAGQT
jgi:antirestriction protein ArdC